MCSKFHGKLKEKRTHVCSVYCLKNRARTSLDTLSQFSHIIIFFFYSKIHIVLLPYCMRSSLFHFFVYLTILYMKNRYLYAKHKFNFLSKIRYIIWFSIKLMYIIMTLIVTGRLALFYIFSTDLQGNETVFDLFEGIVRNY